MEDMYEYLQEFVDKKTPLESLSDDELEKLLEKASQAWYTAESNYRDAFFYSDDTDYLYDCGGLEIIYRELLGDVKREKERRKESITG